MIGSITYEPLAEDYFTKIYYEEYSGAKQYIFSLYSMLMMILGQEIGPFNIFDVISACFIIVIGSVLIAVMFGNISLLITKLNHNSIMYQNKLEALEIQLKMHRIPDELQNKIFEYFDHCWKCNLIYKESNNFKELSLPLQRDISFQIHKDIVYNVPLFFELEPIEIFSIIKSLKTQVYMPSDRIIREGERGLEMYFLTSGLVEVVIKKNPTRTNPSPNPLKIMLKQGAYFGEIALISNSRRTSDVVALDFCTVEMLTKSQYEKLQLDFPDIGPRLKAGLKHYKIQHMSMIMDALKVCELFRDLSQTHMEELIRDYLEELFVDPHRLVLSPKEATNAFYFVLLGSIKVFIDDENTREYLGKVLQHSRNTENQKANYEDYLNLQGAEKLECIDDTIEQLKDSDVIFDKNGNLILDDLKTIYSGEYFGCLDFGENTCENPFYFITDSAVKLGIISQPTLEKIKFQNISLYEALKASYIKQCTDTIVSSVSSFSSRSSDYFSDEGRVQEEKEESEILPTLKEEIYEEYLGSIEKPSKRDINLPRKSFEKEEKLSMGPQEDYEWGTSVGKRKHSGVLKLNSSKIFNEDAIDRKDKTQSIESLSKGNRNLQRSNRNLNHKKCNNYTPSKSLFLKQGMQESRSWS